MGPLSGIRVLELGGIGPAPFGGMVLADMGADVVRVERVEAARQASGRPLDPLLRGKRSVAVDLKNPLGPEVVLRLAEKADAIIEGFRPGVVERLGVGPEACMARNPRLVYARMTGWGQEGPLAHAAGHDIDYIALAGVLAHVGRAGQPPVPPLNLVADFGGGGMLLAFGVVAGLVEALRSGQGQVVDVAMVDGAALLMAMTYGLRAMGMWSEERGVNLLDSGAPFYDVYETADGKYVAVGALEPQFYRELLERLGLGPDDLPPPTDRSRWPQLREVLARVFKTKTREEWREVLEGTDACFAPVLAMSEAPEHPHNRARGNFITLDGVLQPAPAPRFTRTPGGIRRPPPIPGEHTTEVLEEWGFTREEIGKLLAAGAVAGG